jgi:hypothetical protein
MRLVKRQLTQDRGGPQGRRATKNLNIILTWLGAICTVLACSRHSVPSGLTAAACFGVVVANNAARLAYFTHARGVGFAAVSVPLDFLYYLIAGVGVFFGWIARQAIGEPTPGAVAEAYAEMGVKRWPPVPVKRVARPLSMRKERTVSPSSELPDRLLLSQDPAVREGSGDTSQPIQ